MFAISTHKLASIKLISKHKLFIDFFETFTTKYSYIKTFCIEEITSSYGPVSYGIWM